MENHTHTLAQVDWSADSRILQSSAGDYELLFWEAATGKQVRRRA